MTRQSDFIRRFTKAVVDSVPSGSGLFPSVVMAQMIIESGWGESKLSSQYNNMFGIKATKNWKGEVVNMPTREVINGQEVTMTEPFRVYASKGASIKDRNRFLRNNKRYQMTGVFSAKSPEQQAVALQNAGYATDPRYASTLINVIKRHNLYALDELLKKNG
jgi:flagellum-specific peptidoglycan hydrolase FlgJ